MGTDSLRFSYAPPVVIRSSIEEPFIMSDAWFTAVGKRVEIGCGLEDPNKWGSTALLNLLA